MKIYILIYIFILMNAILFFILPNNLKIEKFIFKLTLLGLIFFSGTRYFTGVDYDSYLEVFKNLEYHLEIGMIERFFILISIFFKKYLMLPEEQLFLIFEIINTYLLYKFITNNLNKNLFLALYIWYSFYFLLLNMGQFRFGMAILICSNLISYLYTDSYKKFSLGIILAFFIHRTSIIYLFLLFVKKKIFSNKNLLIFPLISFFVGKFLINIKFLFLIASIINSQKLKSMAYGAFIYKVGFSFYQVYMIILLILLYFYKSKDYRINIIKKIMSLGIGMYFLFINLAIFTRFSDMFISLQTILFPMIINNFHKKINKIIIFILVVIICSYVFFSSLIGSSEYIPYRSWLFL